MIIFNIIQEDEAKAQLMSSFLIEKNYALQTHVDTNVILTKTGKTTSYDIIELDIKKRFFSEGMIIYATPVSYVNSEYGEILRKNLKSV
jgi:hypothetical protein